MIPVREVLGKLRKVTPRGEGWMACCPSHDDRTPSLKVDVGPDGHILFFCYAGCESAAIADALGIKLADVSPGKPFAGRGLSRSKHKGIPAIGTKSGLAIKPTWKGGGVLTVSRVRPVAVKIPSPAKAVVRPKDVEASDSRPVTGRNPGEVVAVYDYTDAAGKVLMQVVRYHPKTFRQQSPDGRGGWKRSVTGVSPVPYNLVAVTAADVVVVVEGEKDVESLRKLGIVATCNAGGAKKWTAVHAGYLKGKHVRILPDNDGPGEQHAKLVMASLVGVAASVHKLPGVPKGKDVSDWVAAGATKEMVFRHIESNPVIGDIAEIRLNVRYGQMLSAAGITDKGEAAYFHAWYLAAGYADAVRVGAYVGGRIDYSGYWSLLSAVDHDLCCELTAAEEELNRLWGVARESGYKGGDEVRFSRAAAIWADLASRGLTLIGNTGEPLPPVRRGDIDTLTSAHEVKSAESCGGEGQTFTSDAVADRFGPELSDGCLEPCRPNNGEAAMQSADAASPQWQSGSSQATAVVGDASADVRETLAVMEGMPPFGVGNETNEMAGRHLFNHGDRYKVTEVADGVYRVEMKPVWGHQSGGGVPVDGLYLWRDRGAMEAYVDNVIVPKAKSDKSTGWGRKAQFLAFPLLTAKEGEGYHNPQYRPRLCQPARGEAA